MVLKKYKIVSLVLMLVMFCSSFNFGTVKAFDEWIPVTDVELKSEDGIIEPKLGEEITFPELGVIATAPEGNESQVDVSAKWYDQKNDEYYTEDDVDGDVFTSGKWSLVVTLLFEHDVENRTISCVDNSDLSKGAMSMIKVNGECFDLDLDEDSLEWYYGEIWYPHVRYRKLSYSKTYEIEDTGSVPVFRRASLKEGMVDRKYNERLLRGGTEDIEYSVIDGELPEGLCIENGALKGKCSKSGEYTFTISATNELGSAEKQFTMIVKPGVYEINSTYMYYNKMLGSGMGDEWTVAYENDNIKPLLNINRIDGEKNFNITDSWYCVKDKKTYVTGKFTEGQWIYSLILTPKDEDELFDCKRIEKQYETQRLKEHEFKIASLTPERIEYQTTIEVKKYIKPVIKKPKGTSIKKIKAKKAELKVYWKKQPVDMDGYHIQFSTNKKFTKSVINVYVGAIHKTTCGVCLKKKKKYYVRIRTYKKVDDKKYYSKWSKVKSKKTK